MTRNTDKPPIWEDTKGGTARTLLFLFLGPIAWAAHHVVMYASHTVICSLGLAGSSILSWEPMRAISAAATAIALALIAAPLLAPETISRSLGMTRGPDWPFYRNTATLLAVLSAAGVAWNGAMAFIIPACLPLR